FSNNGRARYRLRTCIPGQYSTPPWASPPRPWRPIGQLSGASPSRPTGATSLPSSCFTRDTSKRPAAKYASSSASNRGVPRRSNVSRPGYARVRRPSQEARASEAEGSLLLGRDLLLVLPRGQQVVERGAGGDLDLHHPPRAVGVVGDPAGVGDQLLVHRD